MAEEEVKISPEIDNANDKRKAPRQIPGNFPYTSSLGVFKRALENLIQAERPTVFNRDFMGTILNVSGGAANPVIPIFKKTGFLTESGMPTDIYTEFQSASGRPNAALLALKRGFSEIFKKNQYAHKADRTKIIEIIRSVTGLPTDDPIIGYIYGTFNAIQDYAKGASDAVDMKVDTVHDNGVANQNNIARIQTNEHTPQAIGLSYQINIILPETSNIDVFNAIFKSLKENLLK